MTAVMDALAGRRVIAEFPAGLPGWMSACEVLLQERLSAWAFPADDTETLAAALRIYGRRARIGVHGAQTPQQVRDAVAAGAHFVTSPVADADLIEAASSTPLLLGALTPGEIRRALSLGVGVHVVPADAYGMSYSRSIADLFGGVELFASGRFERWQAEMWLNACAAAVFLAPSVLFGDPSSDNPVDLVNLRSRARELAGA